ncbi:MULTISPECIES: sensor histidine kinase [unclassified Streptomyces]|uniref:sensor histidine kinase n=1 Tax=unclassified Streptomyces TaxID=2593676 RepID=UPI002E2B3FC9|nr:ATP-binding protein [Streptomyces sp. NBC_00223]
MTTLSPSRRGSGSAVPNLQRVVLLPGAVLTLLGAGSVAWLLVADPTGTRRNAVLAAVLAVALVTLITGVASARSAQRKLARVSANLDRTAAELDRAVSDAAATVSFGDAQLRRAVEDLRQGRAPQAPVASAERRESAGRFGPLLAQLEYAQLTAFTAVTEAAELPAPNGAATQQVTVLVNLARRLQSLVHQGIKILDELEQQVEDPDLLRGLFEVDHIATRIRRYVENVAVLGGEVTRRQWRKPVPMASVVRSAIGEVERYSRVKPVPPIDGRLDGAAVADVVHLLAELIENATAFSPPGTQVYVRTQRVATGLVVEIEDRGLGQEPEDERMRNTLLANPERVEMGALLKDGRVGLYVVAVLARQHQIRVELRRNLFGGVTSLVLLPNPLLSTEGDEGEGDEAHSRAAESSAQEAGRPAGQQHSAQYGQRQPAQQAPQQQAPAQRRPPAQQSGQAQQQYAAPAAPQAPARAQIPAQNDGRGMPTAVGSAPARGAYSAGYQPQQPQQPLTFTPLSPLPPAHGGGEGRPPLPQRTQQAHMAPQLQRDSNPPHRPGYPQAPEETDYTPATPGLMAAYRRGVRAAEDQPGASAE